MTPIRAAAPAAVVRRSAGIGHKCFTHTKTCSSIDAAKAASTGRNAPFSFTSPAAPLQLLETLLQQFALGKLSAVRLVQTLLLFRTVQQQQRSNSGDGEAERVKLAAALVRSSDAVVLLLRRRVLHPDISEADSSGSTEQQPQQRSNNDARFEHQDSASAATHKAGVETNLHEAGVEAAAATPAASGIVSPEGLRESSYYVALLASDLWLSAAQHSVLLPWERRQQQRQQHAAAAYSMETASNSNRKETVSRVWGAGESRAAQRRRKRKRIEGDSKCSKGGGCSSSSGFQREGKGIALSPKDGARSDRIQTAEDDVQRANSVDNTEGLEQQLLMVTRRMEAVVHALCLSLRCIQALSAAAAGRDTDAPAFLSAELQTPLLATRLQSVRLLRRFAVAALHSAPHYCIGERAYSTSFSFGNDVSDTSVPDSKSATPYYTSASTGGRSLLAAAPALRRVLFEAVSALTEQLQQRVAGGDAREATVQRLITLQTSEALHYVLHLPAANAPQAIGVFASLAEPLQAHALLLSLHANSMTACYGRSLLCRLTWIMRRTTPRLRSYSSSDGKQALANSACSQTVAAAAAPASECSLRSSATVCDSFTAAAAPTARAATMQIKKGRKKGALSLQSTALPFDLLLEEVVQLCKDFENLRTAADVVADTLHEEGGEGRAGAKRRKQQHGHAQTATEESDLAKHVTRLLQLLHDLLLYGSGNAPPREAALNISLEEYMRLGGRYLVVDIGALLQFLLPILLHALSALRRKQKQLVLWSSDGDAAVVPSCAAQSHAGSSKTSSGTVESSDMVEGLSSSACRWNQKQPQRQLMQQDVELPKKTCSAYDMEEGSSKRRTVNGPVMEGGVNRNIYGDVGKSKIRCSAAGEAAEKDVETISLGEKEGKTDEGVRLTTLLLQQLTKMEKVWDCSQNSVTLRNSSSNGRVFRVEDPAEGNAHFDAEDVVEAALSCAVAALEVAGSAGTLAAAADVKSFVVSLIQAFCSTPLSALLLTARFFPLLLQCFSSCCATAPSAIFFLFPHTLKLARTLLVSLGFLRVRIDPWSAAAGALIAETAAAAAGGAAAVEACVRARRKSLARLRSDSPLLCFVVYKRLFRATASNRNNQHTADELIVSIYTAACSLLAMLLTIAAAQPVSARERMDLRALVDGVSLRVLLRAVQPGQLEAGSRTRAASAVELISTNFRCLTATLDLLRHSFSTGITSSSRQTARTAFSLIQRLEEAINLRRRGLCGAFPGAAADFDTASGCSISESAALLDSIERLRGCLRITGACCCGFETMLNLEEADSAGSSVVRRTALDTETESRINDSSTSSGTSLIGMYTATVREQVSISACAAAQEIAETCWQAAANVAAAIREKAAAAVAAASDTTFTIKEPADAHLQATFKDAAASAAVFAAGQQLEDAVRAQYGQKGEDGNNASVMIAAESATATAISAAGASSVANASEMHVRKGGEGEQDAGQGIHAITADSSATVWELSEKCEKSVESVMELRDKTADVYDDKGEETTATKIYDTQTMEAEKGGGLIETKNVTSRENCELAWEQAATDEGRFKEATFHIAEENRELLDSGVLDIKQGESAEGIVHASDSLASLIARLREIETDNSSVEDDPIDAEGDDAA